MLEYHDTYGHASPESCETRDFLFSTIRRNEISPLSKVMAPAAAAASASSVSQHNEPVAIRKWELRGGYETDCVLLPCMRLQGFFRREMAGLIDDRREAG